MSRASLSAAILACGLIQASVGTFAWAGPGAAVPVTAREIAPGAAAAATSGPGDPAEFAQFVEEHFVAPLRQRQVGGAVLVAVRDGRELHRTAYGWRDVEGRQPVDVDRTLFIIASISKTFTATAVAQLKSRGLLDYDDPVARRLRSMRLREGGEGALRIRNLLTHTTGVPDLFLGASCHSSSDCLPLARFLGERQPAPLAPPGTFVSYSNFSNALAGLVVEDVSGLAYGAYLRERIFRPLGMRDTRYDVPGEPPADDPSAAQASGYELNGEGRLVRSPPNYSMFYPAGQIAASGADMGRYLIAHLDGGTFLPDAERRDMQRIHAHNPGFRDGYGWAWNARHVGDVLVLGHGGDLRGVVSDLLLVPQARFGYFAAITGDAGPVLEDFSKAFKARYLPAPMIAPEVSSPSIKGLAAGLEGVYQDFRFAHDDPLQLLSILSETRIRATGSGGIAVNLPMLVGGGTYRFVASRPDEFRVIEAPAGRPLALDARLRVLRDDGGAIRYFVFADRGYDLTATKLPPWRQTRFKLPGMLVLLLAFLVSSVVAAKRLGAQARGGAGRFARPTQLILAFAALGALVFPVWVGVVLASASKWDMLYGLAALGLRPAYALLPLVGVLLVLAAIATAVSASWPPRVRRACGLAICCGIAYLALLAANGQLARLY